MDIETLCERDGPYVREKRSESDCSAPDSGAFVDQAHSVEQLSLWHRTLRKRYIIDEMLKESR